MGLFASPLEARLRRGAYITDRRSLFEVIGVNGATVRLENCQTAFRHSTTVSDVLGHFELVRPAVPGPDLIEHLDFEVPEVEEPPDYDGA